MTKKDSSSKSLSRAKEDKFLSSPKATFLPYREAVLSAKFPLA